MSSTSTSAIAIGIGSRHPWNAVSKMPLLPAKGNVQFAFGCRTGHAIGKAGQEERSSDDGTVFRMFSS